MKKNYFLLLMLIVFGKNIFSQMPAITWNMTNVNSNILNSLEGATGITATRTGLAGYVFTGYQGPPTSAGFNDVINVRIDARGSILWQKKFGGIYEERPATIFATADGGFLNVGSKQFNSLNQTFLWVYKSDSDGNFLWEKTFGNGRETGADVLELPNGDIIVVGSSGAVQGDVTSNAGGGDAWAMKLGSTGSLLWTKSFGTALQDRASSVILSKDGKVLIAGSSSSHGYLAKLDVSNGAVLWTKTFAGDKIDDFKSLTEDPNGNIYLGGNTTSVLGLFSGNHGAKDLLLVKADSDGNSIWTKLFGSTKDDAANSVIWDDNSLILNGFTYGINGDVTENKGGADQWVLRVDPDGNLLWQKTMGSVLTESGIEVIKGVDGGYVVAGSINATSTRGDISCPKGYLWISKLGGATDGVPSGAILRLEADKGITQANGGVSIWEDQSGFNFHATVPSGAAKPQLISGSLNGHDIVRFSGNEGLTSSIITTFECRNSMSVFVVMKKKNANAEQTILDTYSQLPAGSPIGVVIKANPQGNSSCNNCSTDNGYAAGLITQFSKSYNATTLGDGFGQSHNCLQILEGRFDGNRNSDFAQLFINNERVSRNNNTDDSYGGSVFQNRPMAIGFSTIDGIKSRFFTGDIAEIIVYPFVLDPVGQKSVYDYLNKKYFEGDNAGFTGIVTNNTGSTDFKNDGQWKHPFNNADNNKVILSIQDKCDELISVAATAYIDANPVYTSPNGLLFLKRHFKSTVLGTHKTRLYFTESEFASFAQVTGTSKEERLIVIQYQGPTEDGIYDVSDATFQKTISDVTFGGMYGNRYIEFDQTDGGEFWITTLKILPLNLVSFKYSLCGDDVCFSWKTERESQTKSFQLQRSLNGIDFESLQDINAIGKGNNNYQSKDPGISTGEFFYRLKIVGTDGQFSYSQILKVKIAGNNIITISPNPAQQYFVVSGLTIKTTIEIYEMGGRKIKTIAIFPGERINCADLKKGNYLIKIKNSQNPVSKILVKL